MKKKMFIHIKEMKFSSDKQINTLTFLMYHFDEFMFRKEEIDIKEN